MRLGMTNGRTTQATGNVEQFDGLRRHLQQHRDPLEIFPDIPRELELSEVKTVR